jgi:hypothetical protein
LNIDTNSLTNGAAIIIRLYQKINGTERNTYEETFIVGIDPPALSVINGEIAVNDYIRCELYSNKITDNNKTLNWEWYHT